MGDLNTCLLKNDVRSQGLQNVLALHDLSILPSNATHYFPNSNPSLIDLTIVSRTANVLSHGQLTASFSYHDLIYASYKLRPPKRKSRVIQRRNFRDINLDLLRQDAAGIDWSKLLESDSVDTKVTILTTQIVQLFDSHAPLRSVRVKHFPAPWLTPELKVLMTKRDKAKLAVKRCYTEERLLTYKKLRNYCNRQCRDSKRRYIHSKLKDASPGQTWRFLETIGVCDVTTKQCNPDLDLNAINSQFSSPPLLLNSTSKALSLLSLSTWTFTDCEPFKFIELTEDELTS
ncbi:hypothetical protein ACJJTC_009075 [Scirpophaga incertulas]